MTKPNLIGKIFGKLTVISKADEHKFHQQYWNCLCSCGVTTITTSAKLLSGHTKSCGCLHRKDLLGKKFGNLEVIRFDKVVIGNAYWLCKCNCGREASIRGSSLISKHTTTCGCTHLAGHTNCLWGGVGNISGTYWCTMCGGAKRRGIPVEITKQYLWDVLVKQNFICALSGVLLILNSKNGCYDGNASIDRIDSSKAYIEGNIQWVHKYVNLMKLDKSSEEFIRWCKLVADNNK
jgi:hypothetical protein